MKLVLKNGTSYKVLECSTSNSIAIEVELTQLQAIKDSFTIDNLSAFKFTTDDGVLMGEYSDKKYAYLEYKNGIATFYLRGVNVLEKESKSLQEQVDELTSVIIPEILATVVQSQTEGVM
ncbi:hypothetical protein [Anaerosporobacter sp.]|uniref:hypothetical protein n=1 Tax=Anaerosporobacter sp. TaxID=1872529 RepID=UPI00286F5EBF|nr:hypothetical protein [Anaerosporobacter sp.]